MRIVFIGIANRHDPRPPQHAFERVLPGRARLGRSVTLGDFASGGLGHQGNCLDHRPLKLRNQVRLWSLLLSLRSTSLRSAALGPSGLSTGLL